MIYKLFSPPSLRPFSQMTREEAIAYYQWFVTQIPSRLNILEQAVQSSAAHIYHKWNANRTATSLELLGEWFLQNVTVRMLSEDEIQERLEAIPLQFRLSIPAQNWVLDENSYSIAVDIGIYLGEILRVNYPQLRWQLLTKPKSDIDYHYPVVTGGFGRKHHCNSLGVSISLALSFVEGVDDAFRLRKLYEIWSGYVRYVE